MCGVDVLHTLQMQYVAPGSAGAASGAHSGVDPAMLLSLAQLFAASQQRGGNSGGNSSGQGEAAALMQVLQNPAILQMLQNPELMQSLAQNNPLTQLFGVLQQHVGGVSSGGTAPTHIPGLPQIIERMQGMGASGRGGVPGAFPTDGNNGPPVGQLIGALMQPAMAGVGAVANVVGNVARGGGGQGGNGGIPFLGSMDSAFRNGLSGTGGAGGLGGETYASQVEEVLRMGFTDRAACSQALRTANGDVNRAVNILLA